MNAPYAPGVAEAARLATVIGAACDRIAPTWPLDRFIAVNPWWGWRSMPIADAAARLGVLAGTRLTMPRSWFASWWRDGRLNATHLQAAIRAEGSDASVDSLVAALQAPDTVAPRMPLISDLRGDAGPGRPGQTWAEVVTHQVSQHCAAWFDADQASWRPARSEGLYASWRRQIAADRGIVWRQGRRWIEARSAALAAEPGELIADALRAMGVPQSGHEALLTAVLNAIGGWAAWCAWQRWEARLAGRDDHQIVELLAIRLAWEWLLHDDAPAGSVPAGWARAWAEADADARTLRDAQATDWLLQRAVELAWHQPLAQGLLNAPKAAPDAPSVQAVFCIDVRSEVFRRALEGASPAVQTRGFAGFFGLPIAYQPLGAEVPRPQLPGLLPPAACAVDQCASDGAGAGLGQWLAARRRRALGWKASWEALRRTPGSAFSFVESLGLGYAASLLRDSLPHTGNPERWEDNGLPAGARDALRPRLPVDDARSAAATAAAVLRAMGLRDGFAPLVMLAGHGSTSANNPHAAGLDCGACGGQTGEVNARVLAGLLNDRRVRAALAAHEGIEVPEGTHFLPALHDTTTDDVAFFDTDELPAGHAVAFAQLQGWLAEAGRRARTERAPSLGLGELAADPDTLDQRVRERGGDWAQVRPEWGLAGNAAFVVAPRSRTRHLDLGGRAFLHDYDWRQDDDGRVLTLILTAPMVVTNWINLQYHASTVDNLRYGSGDKVLHNVVGGRIGVFEGNGGDLRIGLPMQSLHDGHDWRHPPLRLAVFVEAPREAIERVITQHDVVHQLAGHGWLHLMRIDPEGGRVEQWRPTGWMPMASA